MMITLSTMIFILLADYILSYVESGKILQHIKITVKQIDVIGTFIAMIYFTIKYSEKGEMLSYFLPVLIWYLIYNTIFSFEVFSTIIVMVPSMLFITISMIGILMILLYVCKSMANVKKMANRSCVYTAYYCNE